MQHFETDDRQVVESYLDANDVAYQWHDDGSWQATTQRPATLPHPVTGEMVWFNQAHLWQVSNFEANHREQLLRLCGESRLPTHAYFGDGTPISTSDLDVVREVPWQTDISFSWQQRDLLLLDNMMVSHGRRPFTSPRKMLVAMS